MMRILVVTVAIVLAWTTHAQAAALVGFLGAIATGVGQGLQLVGAFVGAPAGGSGFLGFLNSAAGNFRRATTSEYLRARR